MFRLPLDIAGPKFPAGCVTQLELEFQTNLKVAVSS
jgi:hypothetical protein